MAQSSWLEVPFAEDIKKRGYGCSTRHSKTGDRREHSVLLAKLLFNASLVWSCGSELRECYKNVDSRFDFQLRPALLFIASSIDNRGFMPFNYMLWVRLRGKSEKKIRSLFETLFLRLVIDAFRGKLRMKLHSLKCDERKNKHERFLLANHFSQMAWVAMWLRSSWAQDV